MIFIHKNDAESYMNKNKFEFSTHPFLPPIIHIRGLAFTPKELDNIACLMNGRSSKKAAVILGMSPRTVETHFRNIMKKMEVNSREGIVDFVEKSDVCSLIKERYTELILQQPFEDLLKDISQYLESQKPTTYFISVNKDKKETKELAIRIQRDFAHAGVKIAREKSTSTFRLEITCDSQESSQTGNDLVIYMNNEITNCYCYSFLILLQKLVPNYPWKNKIDVFKKTTQVAYLPSKPLNYFQTFNPFLMSKKSLSLLFVGFITIGFLIYFPFLSHTPVEEVHSELRLPIKSHLLNRTQFLKEIKDKSIKTHELPLIVLVGIGGAGKTTLARQYALSQHPNLIWEFNAERPDTFLSSTESLATSLAKTIKEKSDLRNILEINEPIERNKKLFAFIQVFIKAHKPWIFIYDNVETYQDIKDFIPHASFLDHDGLILITTRNENLNPSLIDPEQVIHIDELNEDEKKQLFISILSDHSNPTQNETREIQRFLTSIPSFPLDVSTAANYIRATNIPLDKYLEFLDLQDRDFLKVEEGIQKESNLYEHTRNKIMAVSLQKLLQENHQFGELLYFISLLDSQNIPTEIMYSYKNGPIVDNLLYHLKKYSLITTDPKEVSLKDPTFSMHRAVQRSCYTYLNNSTIQDPESTLNMIAVAFIDYSQKELSKNPIRKYEIKKAKLLTQHGLTFLKNKSTIEKTLTPTPDTTVEIVKYLGVAYRDLGNFEQSKAQFINAHRYNIKRYGPESIQAAEALANLGVTYGFLGEYKKAQSCYQKAFPLYERHFGKDHKETGWLSVHFGNNYRDLGKYKEARNLYERAYAIFIENYGKTHNTTAWVLGNLGDVYRRLGYLEKAKTLLHQCVDIFQNDTFRHVWGLIHLSKVYVDSHEPIEAKRYLEESLAVYTDYYGENNLKNANLYAGLGNVHLQLKNYPKSQEFFDKAFAIFRENYGEHHPAIAQTLYFQALLSLAKFDLSQAEHHLHKALAIYKDNEYPEVFKVYFALADLAKAKGNGVDQENYKNLAQDMIAKHFPPDTPFARF